MSHLDKIGGQKEDAFRIKTNALFGLIIATDLIITSRLYGQEQMHAVTPTYDRGMLSIARRCCWATAKAEHFRVESSRPYDLQDRTSS
jgi:citrate lyase synthetase